MQSFRAVTSIDQAREIALNNLLGHDCLAYIAALSAVT